MRIRVSDYFEQFRCLAGECPHTCCAKWEVVIDEDTASRYQQVAGPLGDKLRAELRRDEDGDFCFALRGGRCPFLDAENLWGPMEEICAAIAARADVWPCTNLELVRYLKAVSQFDGTNRSDIDLWFEYKGEVIVVHPGECLDI